MTVFTAPWALAVDSASSYLGLNDLNLEKVISDKFEWRTGLAAESYEEGSNKDVGTTFSYDLKIQKLLSSNLYFDVQGGIGYSTGNTQLSDSEFDSDNFFNINTATINLVLAQQLILTAGNIGQNFLNAPLLISGHRSFPGLKQELFYENKKLKVGLITQQSIPTSKSFNIDRTEKEEVPTFMTGSIYSNFTFKSPIAKIPTAKVKWNNSISYFKFSELPNVVAQEGRLYGHLFVDGFEAESTFLYEFAGYLFNTELKLEDENNYEFGVRGYWADNLEAQTNDRLESITYFIAKQWGALKLDASAGKFFKDSEASPAIYSSNSYGRNNRKGNAYSLGLEFTKYKFRIEAKYYDIDTIVSNTAVQNARDNYYLGVETLYVEF